MSCSWLVFFFFKQKTAYEMRISDWSSDVCSSDLSGGFPAASLGGRDDAADDGVVVKTGARRGGGEAGVGGEAGLEIDLQDGRPPGGVDPEVDAPIAGEHAPVPRAQAPKSVASGKCVSAREYHGVLLINQHT